MDHCTREVVLGHGEKTCLTRIWCQRIKMYPPPPGVSPDCLLTGRPGSQDSGPAGSSGARGQLGYWQVGGGWRSWRNIPNFENFLHKRSAAEAIVKILHVLKSVDTNNFFCLQKMWIKTEGELSQGLLNFHLMNINPSHALLRVPKGWPTTSHRGQGARC